MDLIAHAPTTRGYERPDGPTIAKVLASLDGGRNVLATLGTSDSSYLQASGSVQAGFGLDLQEGSLDRRFRTRDRAAAARLGDRGLPALRAGGSGVAGRGGVGAGAHRRPARDVDDELGRLHRAHDRGRRGRLGRHTWRAVP